MKRTPWFLLALLAGCVSRPVELPAGHLVLAAEHSPGTWAPSEADVARFEADLARLFAKPDRRFEEYPTAPLSQYLVRYYGVVQGQQKLIVGEGTHTSEMDLATFRRINSKPDTVILSPFGGGHHYFSVLYDPISQQVVSVRFNAPL